MKTYSPKETDIQREWYIVDVAGKTLGKAATKIAEVLRGKNKTTFSPHLDCGDFVIVVNAKDIHLSGNKKLQKIYYHHTRYPGGLRAKRAEEYLAQKPEIILEKAVAGMIPPNKLKKHVLTKMKVYAGSEHKHEAQTPKPLVI